MPDENYLIASYRSNEARHETQDDDENEPPKVYCSGEEESCSNDSCSIDTANSKLIRLNKNVVKRYRVI